MEKAKGPAPICICCVALAAYLMAAPVCFASQSDQITTVYVVPNTHGTIAGWLVDFDAERNYVLNNYLDHLDRVRDDPNYRFAFSEVPNLITFLQFSSDRLQELKQRVREKRVELSNGFFLEPTVSLSGGEALAQMGVQGLRWYEKVFRMRPRFCWMIDVVGAHRQLPQIVAGLGMEGLFFCRNNPARKSAFWWVAPDGTRLLTLNNPTYAEFASIFKTREPLGSSELQDIAKRIDLKREHSPSPKTLLSLAGSEDYSLAPLRREYPSEFLKEWARLYPNVRIRFSVPSDYVDALQAEIRSGRIELEEYRGDTAYSYNAFWLNIPEVKQAYRQGEHLLQSAEMLATAASLEAKASYPSQSLYESWIQMLINMDRNILWGAAAGAAFKDAQHWDAMDRFSSVRRSAERAIAASLEALAGKGGALAIFNPLNWDRTDPIKLRLPAGKRISGVACQPLPYDPSRAICQLSLPSLGIASFALEASNLSQSGEEAYGGESIETEYYVVRLDPKTGALTSLKLKPSGREILGGQANVVVAESVAGIIEFPADFMVPRPQRKMLSTSSDFPAKVQISRGPLATIVRASSEFYGGSQLERKIIFYAKYPRIDFETVLDLRAEGVVVTVDFPLAGEVVERTRGIPFGFASLDPRRQSKPLDYFLASDHKKYGYSEALLPAVRWSDYRLAEGGGLALLDRGLTCHELSGRTVILGLLNAQPNYRGLPNEMLRGQGLHRFEYAIVPHGGSWQEAEIPLRAWELNAPVITRLGARDKLHKSFVKTSDNVIVEALRRQGDQIEMRLSEWRGIAGTAEVALRLPHRRAAITNLMGENATALAGGPTYRFSVRPQQIVTLRFETDSAVADVEPIRSWEALVPQEKRPALKRRIQAKGHPPRPYLR